MSKDREAAIEKRAVDELGIPIGLDPSMIDGQEVAAGILDEIASAKTADAVFGSEAEGLAGLAGGSFLFLGFKYQASDIDESEPDPSKRWPYVVIAAVDADGVRRILTTGARKVIVQLATIDKLGAFPWAATVREQPLEGGKSVLDLTRPNKATAEHFAALVAKVTGAEAPTEAETAPVG